MGFYTRNMAILLLLDICCYYFYPAMTMIYQGVSCGNKCRWLSTKSEDLLRSESFSFYCNKCDEGY